MLLNNVKTLLTTLPEEWEGWGGRGWRSRWWRSPDSSLTKSNRRQSLTVEVKTGTSPFKLVGRKGPKISTLLMFYPGERRSSQAVMALSSLGGG